MQVLLSLNEHVKARDYLRAQRLRKRLGTRWAQVLEDVDVVLMPAAGIPAGTIRRDALTTGELDELGSAKAISCTCPSNLAGFPAISVPCGIVDDVPVAAQVVGAPWGDLRVLQVARAIEAAELMPQQRPRRYFGDSILSAL